MRGKWASWINLLLGIWLIIAPFALLYTDLGRALANDIVVGALVVIFAAVAIAAPRMNWASWINVVLGVWEIIAPFALGYSGRGAAVTNDILVGVGFVIFGLVAALMGRRSAAGTIAGAGYDEGYGAGSPYGPRDTNTTEEQRRRDKRAA